MVLKVEAAWWLAGSDSRFGCGCAGVPAPVSAAVPSPALSPREQGGPPTGYGSWEHWAREQGIPQERWNDASAVDLDNRGPRLYFQRVPEAKATKNRVHLDLNASGAHGTPLAERRRRIDAEVERLLGAGDQAGDAGGAGGYVVNMADPEGNEFDVQ